MDNNEIGKKDFALIALMQCNYESTTMVARERLFGASYERVAQAGHRLKFEFRILIIYGQVGCTEVDLSIDWLYNQPVGKFLLDQCCRLQPAVLMIAF